MTDDLILSILKSIQKDVRSSKVDTRNEIQRLRTDMNMQFAALSDKLNGHLISEAQMRYEFNNLVERVQILERRLEIID
jgi:predicted nucleic acid-binding protein